MPLSGSSLVAITAVLWLPLAGCADNQRPRPAPLGDNSAVVKDLCSLASMPHETPAQLEVLKERGDRLFKNLRPFSNNPANKRVATATIQVNLAVDQEIAFATAPPELRSLLPTEDPQLLPSLTVALKNLRDACA
jgi:hypothetical protein